ncbi:MAG: EAL domain-containing protein [Nitrospirota bacterium]
MKTEGTFQMGLAAVPFLASVAPRRGATLLAVLALPAALLLVPSVWPEVSPGILLLAMSAVVPLLLVHRWSRSQAQHAYLAALVDASNDALIGETVDGRVVTWNGTAERMFGYTAEEIVGKPSAILIPSDHLYEQEQFMARVRRGECIERLETVRRRKDGHVIPIVLTLGPLRNSRGRLIGLATVARDARGYTNADASESDLAYYDFLTGLPNRCLLMKLLDQALVRARRTKKLVAILFLDLDRFKLVNDTLGHPVGDLVLKNIATRLTGCIRQSDVVARMGGDEFLVILEEVASASDAGRVAQKILDAVALPCSVEGDQELFLTGSIGIVLYPTDSEARDGLIQGADIAMYSAKAKGNTFMFYSPAMNVKAAERMRVETDLRRGLQRQELLLHYQPVVSAPEGAISSVEALIRWKHPDRGLLYPATFIPVAEESGLIVPLSEWVLRAACTQARRWHADGHAGVRIAVNISPRLFQSPNLTEMILRILHETGLDPGTLELELTESLFIQDRQRTSEILQRLHELGIRIAIDDFGIEYSSLGYLKQLPINTLKIDQSFVRDLLSQSTDAAITQTIITLARCLNLSVIAEGVETKSQAALLQSQQCYEMQGYYFSRPMPAESLTALLNGHRSR